MGLFGIFSEAFDAHEFAKRQEEAARQAREYARQAQAAHFRSQQRGEVVDADFVVLEDKHIEDKRRSS